MTRTMTSVKVSPIDPAVLSELRVRDDAGQPPRLVSDAEGSPLRCCLRRIRPGEQVALVAYAPLRRWARETGATPGPYDETGPVFIHPGPCDGPAVPGFPPEYLDRRWVLRRYAADGRILGGRLITPATADLSGPDAMTSTLATELSDPEVAVVHVRALEFGCFQFQATRA